MDPVPRQHSRWRRPTLHLLFILLLGLGAYSNSFGVPFQWDGIRLLREHTFIRDLDQLQDPALCEHHQVLEQVCRRKVGYLSFALNHALHGYRVAGYHTVNLGIHVGCAFLVYALLLALLATPRLRESSLEPHRYTIALCAAALFVAHPLQTIAVTYIYQRLTALAALFYLLAVVGYLAARLERRPLTQTLLFALTLCCALLAIRSKENAATLPVAIALVELLCFSGPWLWRALWVAPFSLIFLALPLPYLSVGMTGRVERMPYFLAQAKVLVAYLAMTLVPAGQSVLHEVEVPRSVLEPLVVGGGLLVLTLLVLALLCARWARRGRPELGLLAFGGLWFFVTQSIESSIFPLHWHMQEQRMYLSLAGLLPALVVGVFLLVDRLGGRYPRRAVPAALLAVAILFGGLSWRRNLVWQSHERLWRDAIERYPGSALAHTNYGAALLEQADNERAVEHLERAAALEPGEFTARMKLGELHRQRGDLELARARLDEAMALRPVDAHARYEAGFVALARGERTVADQHFDRALALEPRDRASLYYCGLIGNQRREHERAAACLERALELMPESAEARVAFGLSLWELGQRERGLGEIESAVQQQPDVPGGQRALGAFYYSLGRYDEARGRLERALRLDAGDTTARFYLGEVQRQLEQRALGP